MHGADRQLHEPAARNGCNELIRVGFDLAEPCLDADFPDRCRRHEGSFGTLSMVLRAAAVGRELSITTHR
jgi:hypothetical protein